MSEVLERAFDIAEKSHWQIKTLGEVCRTSSGGTPSRSRPDFFNGNIPWVKSGELTDGLVSEVSEFISEEALAGSSAKLLPAGTLLIAMYGATVGRLGVLARVAATNQAVCAIFPPPELDPKFLFWYLRRQRSNLIAKAVGGAQPNISQTILRDLELPIPPIGEQREIVAEIEKQFARLDEAVANLQRVKANLKRYKASVLKAAVGGRLVETEATLARREGRTYETGEHLLQRIVDARGELKKSRAKAVGTFDGSTEAPSGLPSGWQLTSTDEIGHVQLGRQRSPKNRSKDFPVKYIRAANITASGLDLSDVLDMEFSADEVERYRLRAGDIVLSEASGSPEHVGKPAVWQEQMLVCCFQNTVIRLRPALPISAFLLICFQSYYVNGVFARIAGGVGINHLSAEKFSRVKVPLPPLAEQTRIVAEVDRHLSIIREVEAEVDANLKRAQALRQATLSKAFAAT